MYQRGSAVKLTLSMLRFQVLTAVNMNIKALWDIAQL
jgi:hypothetical protein